MFVGVIICKAEIHQVDLSQYYQKAVKLLGDHTILIISDDIEWCQTSLPDLLPKSSLQFLPKCSELETLQIMAQARLGGIAANSTFSWWGLWLNQNPGFIRIIPDRWNRDNPQVFLGLSDAIVVATE